MQGEVERISVLNSVLKVQFAAIKLFVLQARILGN